MNKFHAEFPIFHNYYYNQTHWQHANTYRSVSSPPHDMIVEGRKEIQNEIIKNRKPHQNSVPCDVTV